MQYPDSAVCQVPQVRNNIFNSNQPDIAFSSAFAAGYIATDVDLMPPARRNEVLRACPSR
jgi:hypothetical protein